MVTAKKYELRALFKSPDDAGHQWGTLSRSSKPEDFEQFSIIVSEVINHKNTFNEYGLNAGERSVQFQALSKFDT
ncbi:hypothetical protein JCM19233_5628 [Vibrio astriarenae]|nr:hypothetical protein JCM19233_5628 [Vibrio sp. C7]